MMAEARGDQRAIADSFADLARVALRVGDFNAVRAYAERGYAAAEGLEPSAIRMPLHMMAAAARMEGRLDEARALYLRSRELNERLGKEETVAGEDHNLGHVALHAGDRAEAAGRFRAAAEWIFSHDNAYLAPYAYLDAGVLALHDFELERAAQLVAKAHAIFVDTDSVPDPDDRVELDGAVRRLKQQLGPRFDELWSQGAALSPAEAQGLAQFTT
jgi:tetratricopeptide (TPR) repeat protein